MIDSAYLTFSRATVSPTRKTPIILVQKKSDPAVTLGTIQWHGAWRQFCFFPAADCLFSAGCLEDVSRCIAALETDRRG